MKSDRLNLGSGKNIKEGYLNLDSAKLPGVDIVWDLNKHPWPIKSNSFGEIYISHVLEHLDDLIKCLEEIHRISKKDAKIIIKVPIFPSIYSANDPTHKHFFTYFTFEYFEPNAHYDYYSKAKFKIVKRKINFSWNRYLKWISFFVNLSPRFYSRYLSFIFPSNELYIELKTIK